MPVVAAVERGRQLSRRSHIRFAVQRMTDLVGIFFVGACERKLGEPFSSVDVKHGWGRGAPCPHFANGEEQEHSADNVFHYGYFRRISPNECARKHIGTSATGSLQADRFQSMEIFEVRR